MSVPTEQPDANLTLLYKGKVRDVYHAGNEKILLVASDRLSAFDCILPTPIEKKGLVLSTLSAFWFGKLAEIVKNHLITADLNEMPEAIRRHEEFRHRSMLVKKTRVFPVECVVRGYVEGSGWKEYQTTGSICGHALPAGMLQCGRLPEPIFTPSTKAAQGHDENITREQARDVVGKETADFLEQTSLQLYQSASEYAWERGIIIADTKFEFGEDADGNILLIDEVLTPDSSRFWFADKYEPGHAQTSVDKQFVREYLETLDWDKRPPAPALPPEIAEATTARYLEAYRLLSGLDLNV